MRTRFKDISLRKKVPIIFGMLLLVLVGVPSFAMYRYYYRTFSETVDKSLSVAMENNAGELSNLIETISNGIDVIMDNEEAYISHGDSTLSAIAEFIVTYEPQEEVGHLYESMELLNNNRKQFKDLFETILGTTSAEPSCFLFVMDEYPISEYLGKWVGKSSVLFMSCDNLDGEEWFHETIVKNGEFYWFNLEDEPGQIFLTKLLTYKDYRNNAYRERNMGIVMMGFNIDWIEERISTSEFTEDTQIVITNTDGKVIYSNRKGSGLSEGVIADQLQNIKLGESMYQEYEHVQYLVRRDNLGQGLLMCTLIPAYDVEQMTAQMARVIILVMLFICVLGVILVGVLSKYMLRPILRLSAQMEAGLVEQIEDETMGKDEIGQLHQGYNQMQRKIQELIQEAWDSAEKQKKSEMRALQAQINPHFLLNTLASVSSYALINGQDQIASQLKSLSAVMRYNIRKPDVMVPLREEIDNIRKYIEIQRLNYAERFSVIYTLSPECEEVFVPKLIVQPLVENSIIHMVTNGKKGEINIVARMLDEQTMVIIVADNGVGVNTEKINRYMRGEYSLDTAKDSFGVRNVYERIRLTYGKNGDLAYRTDREGHTEAVITIYIQERAVIRNS